MNDYDGLKGYFTFSTLLTSPEASGPSGTTGTPESPLLLSNLLLLFCMSCINFVVIWKFVISFLADLTISKVSLDTSPTSLSYELDLLSSPVITYALLLPVEA